MPTYVYRFVDTGETVEVAQAFTDDTLTEYVHPESGDMMAVKKVFQPVGVTFRGSGFFKTDNRGSAADGAGSSSSGGDSSGDSGSSGSSDSSSGGSTSNSSTSSGSSSTGGSSGASSSSSSTATSSGSDST